MKANLPYYIYRTSNVLYRWRIPIIPLLIQQILRFVFCCYIPYKTMIGKNVHFGYNGLGIIIHPRCIIGNNVHICPFVVLGGRGEEWDVPMIGDNVIIGAGAKILGPVKIGNNAQIGANAVVLQDVPNGATAVGVPARIILK